MWQWVVTGIVTFAATNVDDILVLIMFFSQVGVSLRRSHVVIGQYLGFLVLVGVSLPGFAAGLVVPRPVIGLLGLAPIAIGIHKLLKRGNVVAAIKMDDPSSAAPPKSLLAAFFNPQTYKVATVTIANGGDNIGIYTPLFASSSLAGLGVILVVFLLLVGIWCLVGYHLTRHPAVATVMTRYGHILMPFVLIGIGIFILLENDALSLLGMLGYVKP